MADPRLRRLCALHSADAGHAAQAEDHAVQVADIFGFGDKLDDGFAVFVMAISTPLMLALSSEMTAINSLRMPAVVAEDGDLTG